MPKKKTTKQRCITQEDTERLKEEMDELQSYIEEFSSFLPLAVCTVNPVGVIVDVNRSFEKLTGYKAIEMAGKPLEVVFLEKDRIQGIKESVKKEGLVQRELTLAAKNKRRIAISASVSAREDEAGKFIGFFFGITDISKLKELQRGLEKKVAEKTKELQQRLEDLEGFAKITTGRELKMIELKNRITELEKENQVLKKELKQLQAAPSI